MTFHMCEVRDPREAEVASCLWEKSQKRVFFDACLFRRVSEDVIMPFCVAGVALCDIPHA